jgi:hypothetical protein
MTAKAHIAFDKVSWKPLIIISVKFDSIGFIDYTQERFFE